MTTDESWYQKPPGLPSHTAAGGVVARLEDGRVLLAFVREGNKPGRVLPKGHLEEGENPSKTALREIEEEAGLSDLRQIGELGARERLDFKRRSWKKTHYFLFTTNQESGQPTDPKHKHHVEWFPLDELPEMFWPEQRDLIETNREKIRKLVADPMK